MKQIHISRAGRKAQIVKLVYLAQRSGIPPFVTPYYIAKQNGMRPSSHVKGIINELIETNWLKEDEQADLWGRKTYHVRLTGEAMETCDWIYRELMDLFEVLKMAFEE